MRTVRSLKEIALLCFAFAVVLLMAGCAGTTMQYPPFPDQTKRVEDPTKVRVYLIRPPGGMNAQAEYFFYGTGPAATGPKVDPRQWRPAVPQIGIYPKNPTPDSPWRLIGEVASGAYLCWEEPPHVLTVPFHEGKTYSITNLNLVAGNVYYLRATSPGFWGPTANMEIMNEEEGQALLKQCRPPDDYGGRIQK